MPMPAQTTILAAVDLDRHARRVISQAARLALQCQGHLVVAHVVRETANHESDLPFPQRPGDLCQAMVRHARACLVGMVNHLDLPDTWVEIRVESGALIQSLAKIATELRPRYCLIAPARLGPLSPSAGLAAVIEGLSGCTLLRISGGEGDTGGGLPHRVRHWLAGVLQTPGLQAGQGQGTAAAARTLIRTGRQGC